MTAGRFGAILVRIGGLEEGLEQFAAVAAACTDATTGLTLRVKARDAADAAKVRSRSSGAIQGIGPVLAAVVGRPEDLPGLAHDMCSIPLESLVADAGVTWTQCAKAPTGRDALSLVLTAGTYLLMFQCAPTTALPTVRRLIELRTGHQVLALPPGRKASDLPSLVTDALARSPALPGPAVDAETAIRRLDQEALACHLEALFAVGDRRFDDLLSPLTVGEFLRRGDDGNAATPPLRWWVVSAIMGRRHAEREKWEERLRAESDQVAAYAGGLDLELLHEASGGAFLGRFAALLSEAGQDLPARVLLAAPFRERLHRVRDGSVLCISLAEVALVDREVAEQLADPAGIARVLRANIAEPGWAGYVFLRNIGRVSPAVANALLVELGAPFLTELLGRLKPFRQVGTLLAGIQRYAPDLVPATVQPATAILAKAFAGSDVRTLPYVELHDLFTALHDVPGGWWDLLLPKGFFARGLAEATSIRQLLDLVQAFRLLDEARVAKALDPEALSPKLEAAAPSEVGDLVALLHTLLAVDAGRCRQVLRGANLLKVLVQVRDDAKRKWDLLDALVKVDPEYANQVYEALEEVER